MNQRVSRMAFVRAIGLLSLAGLAVVAALGPVSATGAGVAAKASGSDPTVYIKGGKKKLKFVAPATIVEGETLRVVNDTNPKQVGPHTFSLVEESLLPQTAKERHLCFTPGHICKAIATWHGVKGEGPPTKNPAKAGKPGWDTLGSLSKKGDSWFTGVKPKASYKQKVTADASAGPTKIYFMCAIHPWMHGSIEVLPPGS